MDANLEINLKNLEYNVKKIIENNKDYKYYFAVLKSNCYGLGFNIVNTLIQSGINYICVTTIEEGLKVRYYNKDIPILCIIPISVDLIDDAINNNITITITNKEYVNKIKDKKCLVHIRCNCNYDEFDGPKSNDELIDLIDNIKTTNLKLEGVFGHIFCSDNGVLAKEEINNFKDIVKNINVDIIHLYNSESLDLYEKLSICNGFRIGSLLYNINTHNIELKDIIKLKCDILQIRDLVKNDSIGYDKKYIVKNNQKVAILRIGYGDGLTKNNVGRYVYINDLKYKIVAIFMDLTIIEIDDEVNVNDVVYVIKNSKHLNDIAEYLHTVPEEPLCILNNRINRIYK